MKKTSGIVGNIIWGAALAVSFAAANKAKELAATFIEKRTQELEAIEEVEIIEESL